MYRTQPRGRRRGIVIAIAASLPVFVLAACGGGGSGGGGSSGSGSPYELHLPDQHREHHHQVCPDKRWRQASCSAANKALPLSVSTVPQTALNQKLQLLAGQNALPVLYAGGGTPTLTAQLYKAGDVVNFQTPLSKLGVLNMVEPAAIDTIKKLYGGQFDVLPYRVQHRGHLVQQEDLRRSRHHGARHLARAGQRRRQAQGRRGAPALRFRPAGLAAHAADQRVPVPVARPGCAAEGRRRASETD